MRVAVLVPAADYSEAHDWAYDVQAEVLRRAGCDVEALRWTEADNLGGFDLVTPLVAWGYHRVPADWAALLDRL